MGKLKIQESKLSFTPLQKFIFDEFAKNSSLTKQFYFTGGTALSAAYLHHRESEDLDFFSENSLENDEIEQFIESIAKSKNLQIRFTQRERTKIFELLKGEKVEIKVDFAYYPYKKMKKGTKVGSVVVDSLHDIAINKLHTVTRRTEVKDFVDLYFLLREFTLWDLIYGVYDKFNTELDILWLGSDFLKVNQFDYLPKMLVPLKLSDLQEFYKDLAKKLGMHAVKT